MNPKQRRILLVCGVGEMDRVDRLAILGSGLRRRSGGLSISSSIFPSRPRQYVNFFRLYYLITEGFLDLPNCYRADHLTFSLPPTFRSPFRGLEILHNAFESGNHLRSCIGYFRYAIERIHTAGLTKVHYDSTGNLCS